MTGLRAEVAKHPEVIEALEHLSDALLSASAAAGTLLLAEVAPLSVFAKPLISIFLNDVRRGLSEKIDHALNEFIQAQPNVKRGDGHAGLISISEEDTKKP